MVNAWSFVEGIVYYMDKNSDLIIQFIAFRIGLNDSLSLSIW